MLERVYPFLILLPIACRAYDESAEESSIIGGRTDRSHRAVGQVGRIEGQALGFHCSGSLIGPRTVLTAAHCLFDDGQRIFAPSLAFEVGGITHRIARSAVDRDYDPTRDEAWEDAALLRLREPSSIPPIPVSIDPPLEGVEADVIGFGVTSNGSGGGRRRRAHITLDLVTDREILYDSRESGACYGDSGGPIVQNDALVGITSRGTATDCREVNIAQRADVLSSWIGTISQGDACVGGCE